MQHAPLQKFWRAIRVLRILSSTSVVSKAPVEETVALGDTQIARYAPEGIHGPVLVLLHGVTARGARDRHLVRLARVLASEGVTSYVPHLSGLANFAEDPKDLCHSEQAIHLASLGGSRRVSILGFSLGGGYGLLSAANAGVAEFIDRATVVGGHHRLDEVWAMMSVRLTGLLERIELATENDLYCALGCAQQRLPEEQLGAELTQSLRSLLWTYCDGVDVAAVRRFVASHLAPHWPIIEACQASARSIELSPAGRLRDVRAHVALLHAPDDELIPTHHAVRNLYELRQRKGNAQSLLTTKLLDHVRPRLGERWRELPGLVECFAELLC